jgi:hypothetical protein
LVTCELAAPGVKQPLAAIRHLFDWLVTGQIVPVNPAGSVRGPRHVVTSGQTPVLDPLEERTQLDSIDVSTSDIDAVEGPRTVPSAAEETRRMLAARRQQRSRPSRRANNQKGRLSYQ